MLSHVPLLFTDRPLHRLVYLPTCIPVPFLYVTAHLILPRIDISFLQPFEFPSVEGPSESGAARMKKYRGSAG